MLAEDAQLADSTLDELLRFIAGLRVKRIIKKAEADALEEMLFNNRYATTLYAYDEVCPHLFLVRWYLLHILLRKALETLSTWLKFAKTLPRA